MKSVRMIVAVGLLFVLTSCSLQPMWNIAGKWQQEDGNVVIEFLQSGILNYTDGANSFSLRYLFMDGKRMEVSGGTLGKLVVDVNVGEKELTLTNPQGEVTKYKRLK